MGYQYKVIPFIGQSRGGLSATEVARQLETAINEHVAQGWEFYQLSDVNIEVQPGCISGLFGAKVEYVRFDQLIFRAGRSSANLSSPQANDRQRDAFTSEPGVNTANIEGAQQNRDDEARNRPSLAITSKQPDAEDRSEEVDPSTFCYHCGSDVPVAARTCGACGNSL